MAGDPKLRMGKVMFDVLSKAARYGDEIHVRHFVCNCALRRTITKVDFLLKRQALCLPEEKIRMLTDKQTAYEWPGGFPRVYVPLNLELIWPLVGR